MASENEDEDEDDVASSARAPGVVPVWISCDESGTDGSNRYYGFGSLWMVDFRRGDFAGLIRSLREDHNLKKDGEFKWTKVSHGMLPFYKAVVEAFFKRYYLAFHCLVVRKGYVNRALFNNDMDLAMRVQPKHSTRRL